MSRRADKTSGLMQDARQALDHCLNGGERQSPKHAYVIVTVPFDELDGSTVLFGANASRDFSLRMLKAVIADLQRGLH